MKKFILGTFMLFMTTSAFAYFVTIQSNQSQLRDITKWEIKKLDDGYLFLLGTYSDKILTIHVNDTVENGSKVDPVTVTCNDTTGYGPHRVDPGSSITCVGDIQDMAYLAIDQQNFINGAAGTYEFIPVFG